MKITKLITVSSDDLAEIIIERLSLTEIEKNDIYKIYEGTRVSDDKVNLAESEREGSLGYEGEEDEQIILCVTQSNKKAIDESLNYVFETYQVFKMTHVGLVGPSHNIDIHPGDVLLPNTFLSSDSETPIFLDFAIGENYDFKNFGLILSGICMTGEFSDDLDPEDYGADVQDESSFHILTKAAEKDMLDKNIVIKAVFDPEDDAQKKETVIDNALAILDFVL